MQRARLLSLPLFALAGLLATGSAASAGEDVRSAVTIPAGQPAAIITATGQPLAQGSYAVGVIRLDYTYVGFSFQPGPFATFDLGFDLVAKGGSPTRYPALLNLVQSGQPAVVLTPTPGSFDVTGPAWTGGSTVLVSVSAEAAADPANQVDGATITGNVQLATNSGSRLGTVTSIQVKIHMVHPTACVKQYTFLSNRELTAGDVSALTISYGTRGANVDKLMNMSPIPKSSVADLVLLVNTCSEDVTVDLRVTPDSRFTFPSGNGNTTFLFSTTGELAPGVISLGTLTAGPVYKQVLDIEGLTVAAGESVLVVVHLVLDDTLTRPTIGSSPFHFESAAFVSDGLFTTLAPEVDATQNPAVNDVTFSLVPQN